VSRNDSTTSAATNDLDHLVPAWLNLPEVAERLGVGVNRVRQLLRDGELIALPRGERGVLHVPADFLAGNRVVKGLAGTLTVLHDAGYDEVEAVRWLHTPDDGLDGTPITALRDNRGRQVRRLAQTLGF
jgi:hypothetical protein